MSKCSLQHATCSSLQHAACGVCVRVCLCLLCCVCLVFVSNFMAQRRIRNEIDRQLQLHLPQNIRCASNAPRHVALFAQRRPTQFINGHTHTCMHRPAQGSLGRQRVWRGRETQLNYYKCIWATTLAVATCCCCPIRSLHILGLSGVTHYEERGGSQEGLWQLYDAI